MYYILTSAVWDWETGSLEEVTPPKEEVSHPISNASSSAQLTGGVGTPKVSPTVTPIPTPKLSPVVDKTPATKFVPPPPAAVKPHVVLYLTHTFSACSSFRMARIFHRG